MTQLATWLLLSFFTVVLAKEQSTLNSHVHTAHRHPPRTAHAPLARAVAVDAAPPRRTPEPGDDEQVRQQGRGNGQGAHASNDTRALGIPS